MNLAEAMTDIRSGNYSTKWYVRNLLGLGLLRLKSLGKLLDMRENRKKRSAHYQRMIASYHDEGPRIASEVCFNLRLHGIDIWLYAGSLLGIVREGDFIAWDFDLDLCVANADASVWSKVETILIDQGFVKVREYTYKGSLTEQTYATSLDGGFTFDIFSINSTTDGFAELFDFQRLEGSRYTRVTDISVRRLETHLPEGMSPVVVRGSELPVPNNAEVLLVDLYGPDWRTPNPNYRCAETLHVLPGETGHIALHLR